MTQTSLENQHFQEIPDSQYTEQFQEQQNSLVNQRSQLKEHSLTHVATLASSPLLAWSFFSLSKGYEC